jgi:hypothetical protein
MHLPSALFTLGAIVACGGGTSGSDAPVNAPAQVEDLTPGIQVTGSDVTFRTDPFTLEPGQEKFICSTHTLDHDMVIDGYSRDAQKFVHHLIFAKTAGTEPEGASDCDVLFRFQWEPLFLAGAGASELNFPEGVGHVLSAGTRLLAQLHLFNTTAQPITDSTVVHMHPTVAENPRPMGSYAFGNFNVNLPPLQPSTLTSDCTVSEPLEVVAAIPHMHNLGKSLSFEVGSSAGALAKVFERNPYSFDDQHAELLPMTLNPGDATRVTCNFENTRNETITFGESTNSEMCFLLAFVAGRTGVSGCIVGTPGSLGGAESAP